MKCQICGKSDLFTEVANSKTCSVCTIRFSIQTWDTDKRIKEIREAYGLADGQYINQDNAKEAARILGHS